MARFKLKSGTEEKEIGAIVLQMSKLAKQNGNMLPPAELRRFERQICDLMRNSASITEIAFAFDTDKKLNIVIPFIEEPSDFDNRYAKDMLGLVVVRGCGK